jgi:hypothetical protein
MFGMNRGGEGPLHGLLSQLDEEIEERALVQYRPEPSERKTYWGVLLLTSTRLHVIYGEGRNWFAKLVNTDQPQQEMESVSLESIERVDAPPAAGFFGRLIRGPTRTVTIERRDGAPIVLEIDAGAEHVVDELKRRVAE